MKQNGYSKNGVIQTLHLKHKSKSEGGKPTGMAVLLYQQAITNKLSRLLTKCNIRTVHIAHAHTRAHACQGRLGSEGPLHVLDSL